MARIFLSYAREDADSARALAGALSASGHDVWWDQHIRGGSRFASEIDEALRSAEAVIVLWSEVSKASAWVLDEAAEGRDSGRLVPVALDGCKPPLGFRQFQTIRFGAGAAHGVRDVLSAIEKTAGEAAAPQAGGGAAAGASGAVSVCVLPFVNMSGDKEQDYFSDGITEDVITDLSKVSSLGVIARNTAFTFKGQAVDVKEVACALGVSHVLEGSVRKAGLRVRITAQLIEGSSARHVWGDRWDRDFDDIFAVQDEISHAIVDALQLKLLPAERKAIEERGTNNAEAYNLYLQARQHWVSGNFGDARRAEAIIRLCAEATAIDPRYAQAWALMALAQAELRFWHGHDVDALRAAERAVAINPRLAEAHCVKARYLEEEGRYEDARAQVETALRVDPDSWEANREAARLIFRQGRPADAIPFFEKAAAAMESDHHSSSMLISCFIAIGDQDGLKRAAEMAVARAERVVATDPGNGAAFASAADGLAVLGHRDRAKKWIDRALKVDPDNMSMRYNLACTLAAVLNDADGALELLGPYAERVTNAPHVRHLEVDPDWDSLRGDPRFRDILARAKARLGTLQGRTVTLEASAPRAPA